MSTHNNDCLFCRLIRGEIPSAVVYEDERVYAFLDINPVARGHVLIVPREHAETLFDMRPESDAALLDAMRKVGRAVMLATGAEGLNVIQNNYKAAGQEVPHVHWHLVPRHAGDGYSPWPQGKYADQEEMRAMAEAVKSRLHDVD